METDVSAEKIADVVKSAELSQICNPTSGNCVEVAIAINEIFEIDYYYVALQPGQKPTRPAHIAVMKNGTIIDASGTVSEGRMRSYATAGLKQDEIERADWGPADTSLFENYRRGDGGQQLIDNIIEQIESVML